MNVPNAGIEMPVPRKFCEPAMPGPRTPSAKPWSASGSVGTGGIVLVILLPPKMSESFALCPNVERRAAVEAEAERVGALELEVHDDRLDEDLPARLSRRSMTERSDA